MSALANQDNEESKVINGKENEKPLNFLAKIALGCQQMRVKSDKEKEQEGKGLSDYTDKYFDDSKEFTTDNCGNSSRDNTDLSYLLESICSMNDSHDAVNKMHLLASLTNICMQRPELYETIGSSPLVYYAESLLLTYTEALYMRNSYKRGIIIAGPSSSELILLIPVLKLLISSANMAVQKIRAIFLYQSEVLLQLMRASNQCSYNAISTHNKLHDAVSGKVLVGAILEMSSLDTLTLFAKCFGIDALSLNLKLLGYYTILYDTSGTNEININLNIIRNQSPSGKKYTQSLASSSDHSPTLDSCENIDDVNWSDIIVARILLLKVVLVYMKDDWKEHLAHISSQVQKHLRTEDAVLQKPQIGAVYGFWSSDATFEGEALLMVPCLRGQVMTVTGEWVMFWSVDIGLLGYIPKAKVYSLPENVASQNPLISICLLRGPVCEMDEVFLESAYQLLQIILETNTQTGKHMLICGSGEHILSLFEYPEAIIRVAFLDLLLCLAKNSRDVVEFLVNHQFDVTLLGKLERYVHIYTADLCSCTDSMEKEIRQMVMILQAILEQKEDVRNWSENRRTSRVLQMFLCNEKCLWKQLMERCVSLLGGKSTKTPYNYRESFRYGHQQTYRHDWGRQHERHHGTYLHHSRSQIGDKKARYRDRMRFSDQSGFSCGERRLLKHDRDSKQEYRNESHFTHQQSSMQKHLEQSFDEMCKISPTNELGEKQQANPKEDNPKRRLETQTKAEPERTTTGTLGKQQKENGDYFCMGKVPERSNLCSNFNHNFVSNCKSDSEELLMDGFQASTKTDSEPAADRLLMSGCGGDGKTKIHYGGQPRKPTFRLSKFNTLKPPTSVQNCVTATYHDLIVCSNVPSPEGDTERVTKQIEEVSFDSETDYVIYGTKAAVKPDRTHDLVLDKKLWEMKEVLLAQRLCGLLNNNVEGSMFFGLSIDSIIEGVKLQRKDKDVFRNGIDRIMNRCLIPEVRANSYDIVFTPVLRQDEMVVDLTQHGLYIIEIRVRPMVHMVYMVYQGHKCFMRKEAETVECTAQQKKQDMMDAEVSALKESIKEMGAVALTDLASLAEFVNRYLPH